MISGGNCSGKSLLLLTIHGEYSHFTGDVFIKDNPVGSRFRKSILIDIQPRLLKQETVWNNLTISLEKVSGFQRDRIQQLAELAGIQDWLDNTADELCYSSIKLVELVRSVIQYPYVILLDDPDCWFDDRTLERALRVCDYALKAGTTLLAAGKKTVPHFDFYYQIQNHKLIQREIL